MYLILIGVSGNGRCRLKRLIMSFAQRDGLHNLRHPRLFARGLLAASMRRQAEASNYCFCKFFLFELLRKRKE